MADRVRCYGCSSTYDPADKDQSFRHTHHAGDSLLPRQRLLELLDACQRDRDEFAAELYWCEVAREEAEQFDRS